jgi:hypothetical protein
VRRGRADEVGAGFGGTVITIPKKCYTADLQQKRRDEVMRKDTVIYLPNLGGGVTSELPRRPPRITFESRSTTRAYA